MQDTENGEKEEKNEPEAEAGKEQVASEKEIAELKERILRLTAEFDNYKKRIAKDLNASSDKAKAEIISRLLPVIDEFELAISTMDLKQEHAKGVSLIYSNMISILKSAGLQVIDSSGRYDPYKHEIVLAEESDKEEGTVLGVIRNGYKFKDIMLRPASVIIAKKKHDEKINPEESTENKEEKGE